MESISITELTDNQWDQYFNMTQELSKRYYPEFYDSARTVKEVKEELMKYHDASTQFNHQQYLVIENGSAVASYNHTNHASIIGWNFDVCADEITEKILKYILGNIYDSLCKLDDGSEAINWEYDKRKIAAMKRAGAEVKDKLLITRVYRKNMNRELFESFVKKYQPGPEFKVWYLNEFPDEIISKLPAFFNQSNKDINKLSPNPIDYPDQTEEDIRRYININTDEISKNHILLILDIDNEIAGVCSTFEDKNRIPRLRHNGGFTGVTAQYRGKGFTKFMKAYIYLKLLNENVPFEYASTDTMPWNKYMFRINEELGFRPHKEGFEFKLTKEQLGKYLENCN